MSERVWHRVGTREEIVQGLVRSHVVDGKYRIGLHVWNNVIYALDDVCPHWGVPLSEGCVVQGRIECSKHSWSYDLATGQGHEPWMGDLATCAVEEREGVIYIALPR